MLCRNDRRVLDAATAVVQRLGHDPYHSVASAAIDTGGRIHTGVNVFHFTGGPCAELSVLGQVAAVSDDRVMTIVAVGDRGRGVIAPCGRCRQVLLDLHPDATVILPGSEATTATSADADADADHDADTGPVAVPLRTLLPGAYVSVANGGEGVPRVLRFAGGSRDDVLAGRKTATIRFRDPYGTGPVTFVFEDTAAEGFDHVPGSIERVERRRFADLTAADASAESLPDVATLQARLREHHPDVRDEDVVDVLTISTVR